MRAVASLHERFPAVRVRIAGDGISRSTFEKTAISLGIGDKVVFLGWLDGEQLRKEFRESSVLAMPSIVEEGMGMVLVEAGLMGRPVVASKIGGITDVVRHGENGLLVPPGDRDTLAAAITAVLHDRKRAQAMGTVGNGIARQYLHGRDETIERMRQVVCQELD